MGQGYVIKHMIFFTGYDSLQFLIRRVKPGVYSEGTIQSHKFTNGTGGPPFMAVSLIPCFRIPLVNTQFRAYPFYKASEWMPHKKLLLNSIVF